MTALESLRSTSVILTADDVFEAIFEAGSNLNEGERESESALEIAVRLLEARRMERLPPNCVPAVEFLAEECGLYPYIDPQNFSLFSQTLIEAHSIDVGQKLYLHAKQMQVLLWLLNGDNVILSAPTSFGKSLLLDAFISKRKPHTILIIMPTIALIDETRRRLFDTFGGDYSIVTTTSDPYDKAEPTIFVLTQERYLARPDIPKIDLLFVDEFYKLDPDRDDNRFETLNIALYKALPRARQHFMAGPHVRNIQLGVSWTGNFRFIQTDYRTVTVNVIDRSKASSRFDAFVADLAGAGDESSLVFCATPASAQKLLQEVVEAGINHASDEGSLLGEWISKNYHPEWPITSGASKGVAVHHGRLPRSLGQLFVRLFDAGVIKVLICTSTLIEGVNTSAANVFIYDKKINRMDFDFFSFANIRGRVGRMMRHFVGNAYLYHDPPEEIETNVDVPVLSGPNDASDYIVINVDPDNLNDVGRERQETLIRETGLPRRLLAEHAGIGVDLLTEVSAEIRGILSHSPRLLLWTGFPDLNQSRAVAAIALKIAHRRREQTGVHSEKMVSWAWAQLDKVRPFNNFLSWFSDTFFRNNVPAGVDAAFQFLQACEFSFPRSLAAIEALILHHESEASASYGPFIVALENWFRAPWMKQLDEAGIPLPLAERLYSQLSSASTGREALMLLRRMNLEDLPQLSEMDRIIIREALKR